MLKSVILAGRMKNGKDTVADQLARDHGYVVVGFADALKRWTSLWCELDDTCFWGSSDERNRPFDEPLDSSRIEELADGLSRWRIQMRALFNYRVTTADMREAFRRALLPVAPITSARVLLQRIGTEFGRALWEDVWVRQVELTRQRIADGYVYLRRDGVLDHLRTRWTPSPIVVPDGRHKNETRYGYETLQCPVFWIDAEQRVPRDPRFAHASEPARADLEPYITDGINNNGTLDELRDNVRSAMSLHLGL